MKVGEEFNPWKLFTGAFIPNWLLRKKELNATAKLVYARFCQYGGSDGEVFPKIETLAEEVGCSDRGVRDAIQELEAQGLIRIENRKFERKPSKYKFLWHEWIEEDLLRKDEGDRQSLQFRSANFAGPDRQTFPERSANSAYLLKESQEETQGRDSVNVADPSGTAAHNPGLSDQEVPTPTLRLNKEQKPGTVELDPADEAELDPVAEAQRKGREVTERMRMAREAAGVGAARTNEAKASKQARQSISAERRQEKLREKRREALEMGIEPAPERESTPLSKLWQLWTSGLGDYFPGFPIPRMATGRDWGTIKNLLAKYDYDTVVIGLTYVIQNWAPIKQKLFKGGGDPMPTLGLVERMHDTLFPHASVWSKYSQVIAEYNSYPSKYEVPSDVERAYMEAQTALKDIGISV